MRSSSCLTGFGQDLFVLGRELVVLRLLFPGRRRAVDGEARGLDGRAQRIGVGRVQPARADVEGIALHLGGPGPPADAVARFEDEDIRARFVEDAACREAGRARTDDGDVDVRGHG